MALDKDKIRLDVQRNLSENNIEIKDWFVENSIDNTLGTESISTLSHNKVVEHVTEAILDAHNQGLLEERVYGTETEENGIIVEEVPDDISELNYK